MGIVNYTGSYETLRVQWMNTRQGFQSRVFREVTKPPARVQTLLECAWFKQLAPVYVVRSWQEKDLLYPKRLLTRKETVKGRILGLSRNGKVWVLVHYYERRKVPPGTPNSMRSYWELRLVESGNIEPFGYGVNEPPALPQIWQDALSSYSLH